MINSLASFKDTFVAIIYLVSAVMFIIGIKRLANPKTAVQGNRLGAWGMVVAMLAATLDFARLLVEFATSHFLCQSASLD
jgi:NAD/NADP transhydrogenase beta subunit